MKLVHSEVYMGKTIEVFYEHVRWQFRTSEWDNGDRYTVKISGERYAPKQKRDGDGTYWELGKAIGAAKLSIKKNATKTDEIARLEAEIARLQAELEVLRKA